MIDAAQIYCEAQAKLRQYKSLEGKTYAPPNLRLLQQDLDEALGQFEDGHEAPINPVDVSECNLTFERWPSLTVDWQSAAQHLRPMPDIVYVEVADAPYQHGTIELPPELAANSRPDVGTVIAVGPRHEGWLAQDLSPGDVVAFVPLDGTIREGFEAGSYRARNHVISFGIYCDESRRGEPELYPLEFSLIAKLTEQPNVDGAPFGLHPLRTGVAVRQDPLRDTERGLILPDSEHYRGNTGTVVATGPDVRNVSVGDRIVFHPNALVRGFRHDFDPNIGFMVEAAIEARIV